MKFKFFIIILFISIGFPQLSIKDKQIYNNTINKYYSDDEFIEFLNSDSNFVSDEFFLKYKKSVSKLKFKKSKYIYGFSLMSILTGYDGIVNSDEYQDEDNPPGVKNIAFGVLLSTSYYSCHKIKKKRSLHYVAQRYNDLYSKGEAPNLNSPYNPHWTGGMSGGLFNEKIPISLLDFSLSLHTREHSPFYGTLHSIIFGGGIGLGYKYHYLSKTESSPFISICAHASVIGDGGDSFTGISFSPGYSISLGKIEYFQHKIDWKNLKFISRELKFTRVFINIGASFTYAQASGNLFHYGEEYSLGILPFINLNLENNF